MKKERKLYTSFEQLPLTLNADDIAAYLNISRGNAYTLLHREDFPYAMFCSVSSPERVNRLF